MAGVTTTTAAKSSAAAARKKKKVLGLGIESTAHTFSCAIMEKTGYDRGRILSDVRHVYRPDDGEGIHPREASRHHVEHAPGVLAQCLAESDKSIADVDLISYAAGPGLGPCLRVGAVVARSLASFHGIPIYPVNHAIGHIELGKLLTGAKNPLVLLVSGGHTMLLAFLDRQWRVFGETLDITLGQLLDQFGRALGLASPCGRDIEEMAQQQQQQQDQQPGVSSAGRGNGTGDNHGSGVDGDDGNGKSTRRAARHRQQQPPPPSLLPRYVPLPYTVKGNDVSFSGLLSAAKSAARSDKYSACFSLQETAFAMIGEAVERALSFTGKRELMVVGGVAANKRLSAMLSDVCRRHSCRFFVVPLKYAGDCGSQICWTGLLESNVKQGAAMPDTFVTQSWRLDTVRVEY